MMPLLVVVRGIPQVLLQELATIVRHSSKMVYTILFDVDVG
jgi:hypothetical protein